MFTYHVQMEAGPYMGIWHLETRPANGDIVVDAEDKEWKVLFTTIHVNKARYPRLNVRKHF